MTGLGRPGVDEAAAAAAEATYEEMAAKMAAKGGVMADKQAQQNQLEEDTIGRLEAAAVAEQEAAEAEMADMERDAEIAAADATEAQTAKAAEAAAAEDYMATTAKKIADRDAAAAAAMEVPEPEPQVSAEDNVEVEVYRYVRGADTSSASEVTDDDGAMADAIAYGGADTIPEAAEPAAASPGYVVYE